MAVHKHSPHVRHLTCDEVAQVEARQLVAAVEHTCHNGHLAGVEVLDTADVLQILHIAEPVMSACRSCCCK